MGRHKKPYHVSERAYKITKGGNEERGRGVNYRLGVPPRLAELIPAGVKFRLEVDGRGFHYVPDAGFDVTAPWLSELGE